MVNIYQTAGCLNPRITLVAGCTVPESEEHAMFIIIVIRISDLIM
jgi:hypothetical protein